MFKSSPRVAGCFLLMCSCCDTIMSITNRKAGINQLMNEKQKKLISAYEWVDALTLAMLLIVLIYGFVFKVYTAKGTSMYPTVQDGERVFVWSALYKPKAGDVVILDESLAIGDSIIKRVAATGGQLVDMDKQTGEITVDGVPFNSPIKAGNYNIRGDTVFPLTVPDDCVFVLGDNREVSLDSRYSAIGPVLLKNVIGRASFSLSNNFGAL